MPSTAGVKKAELATNREYLRRNAPAATDHCFSTNSVLVRPLGYLGCLMRCRGHEQRGYVVALIAVRSRHGASCTSWVGWAATTHLLGRPSEAVISALTCQPPNPPMGGRRSEPDSATSTPPEGLV